MQKRRPDLMIVLALFVGLGVIATTTVQGDEISRVDPGLMSHELARLSHGDDLPGPWAALLTGSTFATGEISVELYGVDVGLRDHAAYTGTTGRPYLFVGVQHSW